jgi:anaphase-promoting complex subunit 8
MWNAMGNCYEKMDRREEAAKCHERAERFKDKEGIALHKLAQLFITMGESQKAATCFIENLKRKDHEGVECSEIQDAVMYLAKYYKALGRYEESLNYCRRLQDYSGTYREEAMALIREINSIMISSSS